MEQVIPTQPSAQILCPFCSTPVNATAFFCPTCGKNIRVKPLSTEIIAQIGLYLASILLPPLFVGLTIKYLKSTDQKAQQIGIISLTLTILALVIAIWSTFAIFSRVSSEVNQQLNQYQNIGF